MINHWPEAEVTRHLARYFHDHPLASDTPEGIRRWWLPPEANVSEGDVVTVLGRLKTLGIIEERAAADGRVRYRRIRTAAAARALDDLLTTLDSSSGGTAP